MEVFHYATASLTGPGAVSINAVQGDGVRVLVLRLRDSSGPWSVPNGVRVGVSYALPDKTEGYYEELSSGKPAAMIAEDTVWVALDPVLTRLPGTAKLAVVLRDGDRQLATFPVQLRVSAVPGRVTADSLTAQKDGFDGKIYYGGPGGTMIPLGLGPGVQAVEQADGSMVLEAAGGGSGGGIAEESDPTVPAWAKQAQKPGYTAQEVGADPVGTAAEAVESHDTNLAAHPYFHQLLAELGNRLNALADSDDTTLDQFSEIVAFIKSNKNLIDAITTSKVSVADVVNNLVTNVADKPLSAAMGVELSSEISSLESKKLDAATLPEAINTALAQAKQSGEFDGEKGDPGQAATFEITSATALEYGAAPTVTEVEGSTAQTRKYAVGIPAGKPGANGTNYVLTADDRALIANLVIEDLGGRPVYGYVEESTRAVVLVNAPGTDYTYYYEMADGTLVEIGVPEVDDNVYYTVTNHLSNCVSSNSAVQAAGGEGYDAVITAVSGYALESIVVTMGGADITAQAVNGGTISIAEVTGDIVITAVAAAAAAYTNLAQPDPDASGQAAWESGGWCNGSYIAGSSYAYRESTDATRVTTNVFAVEAGDTIYVKGIKYAASSSNCQIALLGADGTRIYNSSVTQTANNNYISQVSGTDGEDAWSFRNAGSTGADTGGRFIRLAGYLSGGVSDVIITRNQPIE